MNGERSANIQSLSGIGVSLALLAGQPDVPENIAREMRRLAGDIAEYGDAVDKFVRRVGGEPR